MGVCLGRGGFGEVYRATLRTAGGLETEVALKVLRRESVQGDAIARFRDEGRVLARFQHPCVVKAHDWAVLEGTTALVTEFVDGFDLSSVVGAIPPRPALEVTAAIASALDAAWSTQGPDGRPLRIVHRDLKPTNVRLGRHGQVKLLDFGIAVLGSPDREAKTHSAVLVGSLPYMAPERFVSRDSTPAVDVYGLGCCLYEALAGAPFHVDARMRDLSARALAPEEGRAHRDARLAALPADTSPEVSALLSRCLDPEPDHRPAAAEVAAEAHRLASTAPGPTLRRFCAEHPGPGGAASPGPWTGRTLQEGAAPAGEPDRSRPTVAVAARETLHPDATPPPRPTPAPVPVVVAAPLPAVAPPPTRAPWVLAGVGCLGSGTLVAAGLAGLAAGLGLAMAGG